MAKLFAMDTYCGEIEEAINQDGSLRDYHIIGCDEVGRGPLAGPVTGCAVYLPSPLLFPPGLEDSKKLSEKKRASLEPSLKKVCAYVITDIDEKRIDDINILQASLEAMACSVEQLVKTHHLDPQQCLVLVDGKQTLPGLGIRQNAIIKGDARSLHIAAASILAKQHRDRWMTAMDDKYPGYQFSSHKGYPSKKHREAIAKLGPSPIHRMSFKLL